MAVVQIPDGDKLSPELVERLKEDLETNPVRKLTKDERMIYGKAASKAALFIPAFRDAIALMRPYMDASASTAHTDPYARVAFGYWFFYIINDHQRASVILHECMHVLNNHFKRAAEVKSLKSNQQLFNLAGDFEINTVLNRVEFVDLSAGALPDRAPFFLPPMKTMEIYAELLQQEQKKREENCPVHGKDAKEKRRQEQEKQKQEEQAKGDSEAQDSPGAGDDDGDQDGGSQPGDAAGQNPGGQNPGGSGNQPSEGHQHGNSGPKCNCGKDHGDEDGDGEGEGQGDGQGNGQGNGSGQGKGQGHSNGSGNAWGCDDSTEAKEKAADAAGISRASDVEQTIAKANTTARIVDAKNSRSRGTGHMDAFWDSILQHLLPKKVDWRKLFRAVLTQSNAAIIRGRQDYTYRRTSRRLAGGEFVFPGMVNYLPKITLAIDTSGSMGDEDYQRALNEIEGIVREVAKGKDCVSIFSVDTRVGNIKPVTSVKKIRLTGGGGTIMAVAWRFVKELPKKEQPDIFVLSTDGYIDWADVETEVRSSRFNSIILVTQQGGFDQAPESLKKLIPIICIDEGKN